MSSRTHTQKHNFLISIEIRFCWLASRCSHRDSCTNCWFYHQICVETDKTKHPSCCLIPSVGWLVIPTFGCPRSFHQIWDPPLISPLCPAYTYPDQNPRHIPTKISIISLSISWLLVDICLFSILSPTDEYIFRVQESPTSIPIYSPVFVSISPEFWRMIKML